MTLIETNPKPARPIASDAEIRAAQSRVIDRLCADPQAAVTTATLRGRVGDGLACTVREGRFEAVMDLGAAMGGAGLGPSPSFFARAAIAGCVAIAARMTAAREGLNVLGVDVAVETDFDDLALFGKGSGGAGPIETRIALVFDSHEPEARIADLVERVLAHDPWFLALRDSQKVRVETRMAE